MPPKNPDAPGRREQLTSAFRLARANDPRLLPYLVGAFLGPLVVLVILGIVLGQVIVLPILGVLLGALAVIAVFSRRFQKVAFGQVEGRPGAAASLIQGMRGGWRVTPAVQVNRNSDLVHRVVGRAGVVLVAEGRGRGPRELLANEARRVRRVVGETPVHDIVVGDGEGEVPLRKLQMHITRLPRSLKGAEVNALDTRLKALSSSGGLPIPKGPVPTRVPRGKAR